MMKEDSQFKADMIDDNTDHQPIFRTELDESGKAKIKQDEWYFMQLPQILNMCSGVETHSLRNIPSGNIGKLRIHKSGKVTMKLTPPAGSKSTQPDLEGGDSKDVIYNLSQGVQQTFYNEMAYLSAQDITFLPKLTNKIVVTPDLYSML